MSHNYIAGGSVPTVFWNEQGLEILGLNVTMEGNQVAFHECIGRLEGEVVQVKLPVQRIAADNGCIARLVMRNLAAQYEAAESVVATINSFIRRLL